MQTLPVAHWTCKRSLRGTWVRSAALSASILSISLSANAQTPTPSSSAPATVPPLQPLPPPGSIQPPPDIAWPTQDPNRYPTQPPVYRTPPGYGPPAYGYQVPYNPNFYGPPTLPYVEGKPAPPGYRPDTQIRKGLALGGAITLGSAYMLTLLAASAMSADDGYSSSREDNKDEKVLPLFIPALGPFIGIATLDPSSVGTAWLILDGLTQSAGLAMLIAGLSSPSKRYLRNDIVAFDWRIAPIVTSSHRAFGMVGHF